MSFNGFNLSRDLWNGDFPEQKRMVKMATALAGFQDGSSKRCAIIRLAQRLKFKEIAQLVSAFHHAALLEGRCERLVHWYMLSDEILTRGKLDFEGEDPYEPGKKITYGRGVVEADTAKWAQAVKAIFPGGDPEIERSLAEELKAAANIEDAKIRKIRIDFVKARQAALDTEFAIFKYLDKGASDAGTFVCSRCGCEVLETSSP